MEEFMHPKKKLSQRYWNNKLHANFLKIRGYVA